MDSYTTTKNRFLREMAQDKESIFEVDQEFQIFLILAYDYK